MPPFKQPQKRRKSSESTGGRSVRSRGASQRASRGARSGSRYSSASRTNSAASLPVEERSQSSSRPASRHFGRLASLASSRTSDGEEQSTPVAEHRDDDANDDPELLNEVIMAVNVTDRGTVGCAYYAARTEKLYFMEDLKFGGPDIVDACKCLP